MIRLQQAPEAFLAEHPTFPAFEHRIGIGRHIFGKTLVAAFGVVMRQELAQGVFELPLIGEDQATGAFLLDGADPAFREGVHVGGSRPRLLGHGRPDRRPGRTSCRRRGRGTRPSSAAQLPGSAERIWAGWRGFAVAAKLDRQVMTGNRLGFVRKLISNRYDTPCSAPIAGL